MQNYLQRTSFFVHSETYNQKETTIFEQFATVSDCVGIFMLIHFESISAFWPNLNSQPKQLDQLTKDVLITNLQSALFP